MQITHFIRFVYFKIHFVSYVTSDGDFRTALVFRRSKIRSDGAVPGKMKNTRQQNTKTDNNAKFVYCEEDRVSESLSRGPFSMTRCFRCSAGAKVRSTRRRTAPPRYFQGRTIVGCVFVRGGGMSK